MAKLGTEAISEDKNRDAELVAGYREMATDAEHEADALEWIEALVGDVGDEDFDPKMPLIRHSHEEA
jgi:hypothetical protein